MCIPQKKSGVFNVYFGFGKMDDSEVQSMVYMMTPQLHRSQELSYLPRKNWGCEENYHLCGDEIDEMPPVRMLFLLIEGTKCKE